MIAVSFKIDNRVVLRRFANLEAKVQQDITAKAISDGLTIIRKAARAEAPVGPTGNLQKSQIKKTRKSRRSGRVYGIVGPDNRRAKHEHLVYYGTAGRRFPKKARALRFVVNGQTVFAKSVAPMPANDYLRRAFVKSERAARNAFLRRIISGIRNAVR